LAIQITYFFEKNSRDELTMRSADGDDVVQTETENRMRGWGVAVMEVGVW
jgi:hypothetical protein